MSRSFPISVPSSLLALLFAGVFAGALAGPARAQRSPDAAEAEKEYNIGRRAEELGNLRLAATHYKRAYDLFPTPMLLYTLAHTHRLLGDRAVALDYYKQYVEADPDGPRVRAANKYIKLLSAAVGDGTEPKSGGGGEDSDGDDDTGDDDDADDLTGDDDGADVAPIRSGPGGPTGPRDSGRSHTLRWVGVGIGAVGLAGLATGIAFGIKAQSLASDINNPGIEWDADELAKFDEGEAAERNQIIFTAGGGVLLLTGVVLVVVDALGSDGGDDNRTVAAPVVGPDRLGLAVGGRF